MRVAQRARKHQEWSDVRGHARKRLRRTFPGPAGSGRDAEEAVANALNWFEGWRRTPEGSRYDNPAGSRHIVSQQACKRLARSLGLPKPKPRHKVLYGGRWQTPEGKRRGRHGDAPYALDDHDRLHLVEPSERHVSEMREWMADALAAIERERVVGRVRAAVEFLPERQRFVIRCLYWDAWTAHAIAKALRVSNSTVWRDRERALRSIEADVRLLQIDRGVLTSGDDLLRYLVEQRNLRNV